MTAPNTDGCHCATCTCNPGMTRAIRFDTSPAAQEGAVRDHLIALGWTPPDEHALSQPSADQFIATFRCEDNGIVGVTDAKIHSVTRHDDGVIEVVIDHWPNGSDAQSAEVEALRAEVERLRGLVVSRFDQDSPPTFRQGTPEHELEDPVTAEQCAWFVAEIKRLRTENERLHEQLRLATVDQAIAEAEASDAHAENKRLREALALLPDEIVMIEHNPDEGPLMFCCGRKVKLSWLHDLIPTHDKDCWYARMRALLSAVERDAPEVAL